MRFLWGEFWAASGLSARRGTTGSIAGPARRHAGLRRRKRRTDGGAGRRFFGERRPRYWGHAARTGREGDRAYQPQRDARGRVDARAQGADGGSSRRISYASRGLRYVGRVLRGADLVAAGLAEESVRFSQC